MKRDAAMLRLICDTLPDGICTTIVPRTPDEGCASVVVCVVEPL